MTLSREQNLFQIFVIIQIFFVNVIFWGVYFVQFFIRNNGFPAPYTYLKISAIVVIAMALEAFFRPSRLKSFSVRGKRIIRKITSRQFIWITLSILVVQVFSKDQSLSRSFLALFLTISAGFFAFTNYKFISFSSKIGPLIYKQWKLKTLLVGSKNWIDNVSSELAVQMGEMIQKDAICLGDNFDKISIKKRIAKDPPDLLMMPVSVAATDFGAELSRQADNLGYRCWINLELIQSSSEKFHLERLNTLDVLMPPPIPLAVLANRICKRLFDLALALLIVILVLPPLMLFVWFLHQLFSQGPLFFTQRRVGRNGKFFKVFKFRSLNVKNENESQQVAFDDDRFFKGGRFIRKFSIDEFPQFLNVLVGNMSLVGPRPHMEQHEKDFALLYEKYGLRRMVKPGITGLAQVKGFRGEVRGKIDIRHRGRMDIFYVKNWSILFDIIIIIKTLKTIVVPPKTAY